MTVAAEFDLIERYFRRLGRGRPDVVQGIGDDCARVTVPAGHELVVSIDTLVSGVHFPEPTSPEDLGWKALACGLSDLAAAGASPAWAMLALTLPRGPDLDAWLDAFCHGFGALASEHDLALVGGDTTAGPLSVTVQVAGHVPAGEALGRGGAGPGDVVCVSGWPGEAAAGLAQLQCGAADVDPHLYARLARPTPRIDLGLALRGRATACIDVSDGLAADVGHIAAASGCGILLDEARLPISAALAAAGEPATVLDWLLNGGDDYELCFTLPSALAQRSGWSDAPAVEVSVIGTVDRGQGVRLRDRAGIERDAPGHGYGHFGDD